MRQPSAVSLAHVTSVGFEDDEHAIWTFDTTVTGVSDASSLSVNGVGGIGWALPGGNQVEVVYDPGTVSPGASWACSAGTYVSFTGGKTLASGSGIVS